MSGICGIIHLDGKPVERAELERMAHCAGYRGPNGIYYHFEAGVGIACLSLDITSDATGKCSPLVGVGGTGVFAADARLDNREDFSEFTSKSFTDSEVMFSLLSRYGEKGPERFIGDFAYALWDGRRGELRLAKDGMGMRSLYYRVESRRIIFATEVKQILAAGNVVKELNEQAVGFYLCGMQVPPGIVFYKGIDEVKPAEEVIIDLKGKVKKRNFWLPNYEVCIRYRDEREYYEHFRELFIEAVRCRMRAISTVGVSLSGGMDSGSVASTAGWLALQDESLPKTLAYTWAFNNFPDCDERGNAYRIARRYQIPVREIPAETTYPLADLAVYEPDESDPFSFIYQSFIDEVLANASCDSASLIFFALRGDVTCGDFIYDVPGLLRDRNISQAYREILKISKLYNLGYFSSLSKHAFRPSLREFLPKKFSDSMVLYINSLRKNGKIGKKSLGSYRSAESYVSCSFLEKSGLPIIDPLVSHSDVFHGQALRNRYKSIFSHSSARVIQNTERLCAKRHLGFADPFSDRRIVQFVLGCPQYIVNTARNPKNVLRCSMEGIMPKDFIMAARKVSPQPLYEYALREKVHDDVVNCIKESTSADMGFLDKRMLMEKFSNFSRSDSPVFDLWSVLSLDMWLKRYWS